ncbi:MAG: TAXI family TRAP transporter solute-binding subunit [Lysobacterales bacterium]
MKQFCSFLLVCLLLLSVDGRTDQQLSIATGGTGGVYFPIGGGLAELINARIEGYSASAEVTGGSVENVGLVARGDADFAISLADTAQQAHAGTGRFQAQPLPMLRGVAGLYGNLVQIVAIKGNGVESLADMRGRRVSVGAPGSGTEVNARAILDTAGPGYAAVQAQRLNFNESADALRNGDIDAGFWSVAVPTSSILNLATHRPVRLIGLTQPQIAAATAADPAFHPATIPSGVYPGINEAVNTLGVANILVVSEDLPEALVYEVTKALFTQVEQLAAIHPAAGQISIEYTLESMPIPLHPGAIRYLQESGANISEPLRR